MADVQHRVADLENEIKVLKNEIKAILLDIREQYLNAENPFNAGKAENESSGPTINIGLPAIATAGTPATVLNLVPASPVINSPSPAAVSPVIDSPSDMGAIPSNIAFSTSPELDDKEESKPRKKERDQKKGNRKLPSLEDSIGTR